MKGMTLINTLAVILSNRTSKTIDHHSFSVDKYKLTAFLGTIKEINSSFMKGR